jgi:Smg protein
MFEVLVYMFENYFEANIHPDQQTLEKELFAAGFDQEDINGAFNWFSALEEMSSNTDESISDLSSSLRIFTESETQKLGNESLSFIMFLEQASVLNSIQRELIVDRAMALPQPEVTIEETRWIVLMALWKQDKAQDYLFVEDAIFNDSKPVLH